MNPCVLALDTETELITDRCKAPRLVCVSWANNNDGSSGLFKHDDDDAWGFRDSRDTLRSWLRQFTLVGHNIAYDMGVLCRQWPDLIPLVWEAYADNRITDTFIRQKLIDIASGAYFGLRRKKGAYSLAGLAARHTTMVLNKGEDTWRLRYGELRDVPLEEWPEEARTYPVDDARATLAVYQAQEKHEAFLADQWRQTGHAWWLQLISIWGIKTDLRKVALLKAEIERDYLRVRQEMIDVGFVQPEDKRIYEYIPDHTGKKKRHLVRTETKYVRKTAAVKAQIELAYAGREIPKTDKGNVSTGKKACKESRDPMLVQYTELSHLGKLLTSDIPKLSTGEIHASFDSLLETGRTSCRGFNLQNPPRKGGVRECFVPRRGYVFADADYDGLELRTMAQACLKLVGESALADVLNAGGDPHLDLAASMLGISYDEALERKGDKDVKDARQFAKIPNFGKPGGMGSKTLVEYADANGVTMTPEKANELSLAWIKRWPEFVKYFALAAQITANGSAIAEQIYSGRFRSCSSYSKWCNTFFQGLGADAAKAAGFAVSRACYDPSLGSVLYGSRIVNFVHDQFILEVPIATASECAKELGRIMCEEASKWLPDVPATTTPALCEYWSKDAVAVYDEAGTLIPWTPVEAKKEAKIIPVEEFEAEENEEEDLAA